MSLRLLTFLAANTVVLAASASERVFTPADIVEWEKERFENETAYILSEIDGREAVHAVCDNSASALYLEREIDLNDTPIIEWSWRIQETFGEIDETTKSGDDYPARVYAVVDGGWRVWRSKAVNYVWASNQPKGSMWPNAYTSRAKMLAVRSGNDDVGVWVTERRNMVDDFEKLHGSVPDVIHGIAIMTDCDDLGTGVEAWYGEVRLLSD